MAHFGEISGLVHGRWRALCCWLAALLAILVFQVPLRAEEALSARRARIEKMTPAEKDQLRQRLEDFNRLDPDRQERFRKLHEQLEADPELLGLMERYRGWLATLSPKVREELAALEPAARIAKIKKLLGGQGKGGKRLSPQDARGLAHWMQHYVAQNEALVTATVPKQQRTQLSKMPPAMRRQRIALAVWQPWSNVKSGKLPPLSERDVQELLAALSGPTRRQLQKKPPEVQRRAVVEMVRNAARQQVAALRRADAATLEEFFGHLSKPQQDRLLGMSAGQMQRELSKLYATPWKPPEPPPHRGRVKRPGKPSPPPRGHKKKSPRAEHSTKEQRVPHHRSGKAGQSKGGGLAFGDRHGS